MPAPEQDPYYDSVRGKADKSEFGSLRMPMHERRPQPTSGSLVLRLIGGVLILIALAVVAKRYLI